MFCRSCGRWQCSAEVARSLRQWGASWPSAALCWCAVAWARDEAACRGAKGAGGLTVGILPGTARRDAIATWTSHCHRHGRGTQRAGCTIGTGGDRHPR